MAAAATAGSSSGWACQACTLINEGAAVACAVCHTPRPDPGGGPSRPPRPPQPPAKARPWVCTACRTVNSKATQCRACGYRPGGAPGASASASRGPATATPTATPTPPQRPPQPKRRESSSTPAATAPAATPTPPPRPRASQRPPAHPSTGPAPTSATAVEGGTMKAHFDAAVATAKARFQHLQRLCQQEHTQFVDETFPATPQSIGRLPNAEAYKWRRAGSVWGRKCSVMDSPQATDIVQGELADCWLASAMSLVAQRPELLGRLFLTKEVNPAGLYQIRLCPAGQWQTVVIDDHLPFFRSSMLGPGKQLCFSRGRRNQLWVPLLEKAIAKCYGSYEALASGQIIEGLSLLTGLPCTTLRLKAQTPLEGEVDLELMWAKLLSSHQSGYPVGALIGEHSDPVACARLGLQTLHAYAILDVWDGDGLRLVRLRNPWGRTSWTGDFCDGSPLWPPALRERLQANQGGSGVFWMAWYDFVRHFDRADVLVYRPDWVEARLPGAFPIQAAEGFEGASVRLAGVHTELGCTVFQTGLRGGAGAGAAMPVDVSVCLASRGPGESEFRFESASRRGLDTMHTFEGFLPDAARQYLVLPTAVNQLGRHAEKRDYALALHSQQPILVEKCTIPLAAAARLLCAHVAADGQEQATTGMAGATVATLGGQVVAINRSQMPLAVTVTVESQNCVNSRGSPHTSDTIPAGRMQLVQSVNPEVVGEPFSFSYQLQVLLGGRVARREAHDPPIGEAQALHATLPAAGPRGEASAGGGRLLSSAQGLLHGLLH